MNGGTFALGLTLNGGAGNDQVTGGIGNDTMNGGDGNDTINGNAGVDLLTYASTATAVTRQPRDGRGAEHGRFRRGHHLGHREPLRHARERHADGLGDRELDLRLGRRRSHWSVETATTRSTEGKARIRSSYSTSGVPVTVNLSVATAQNTGAGADLISNVENAVGGSGSDTLTGTAGANTLTGGPGNDALAGGDGDDRLDGGDGRDRVVYGSVRAVGVTVNLAGGLGRRPGNRPPHEHRERDRLAVGRLDHRERRREQHQGRGRQRHDRRRRGGDRLEGGDGADRLGGGAGVDEILGGRGNDRGDAGGGNDLWKGGAGRDHIGGGAGRDTLKRR